MSFHENEKPSIVQLQRKIPREARPDSCATEALRQFLRDISPPAEALSSDTKRWSGASSKQSRSKAFFKNLLRSNPPQQLLLNTCDHGSNASPFSHNCVVLRQVVPGQHQQYYRIVRDSSCLDSLETKSTFRVNYQFPRHDVNEKRKDNMGKKNIEGSSEQVDGSHVKSASTHFKPRFRIRVRKAIRKSSKQGSPSHDRSINSQADEERRGRSSGRSESAVDEQVLDSLCHQSIQPQVTSNKAKLQGQEIMLQNKRLENIPQLSEIATGSAFPASEIIKSWGRRRSLHSTKSSPGKIQSGHSRNVHTPKATISSKNMQTTRVALSAALLQSPAGKSLADDRLGSTLPPSAKQSKQLASPVKLSSQKQRRQNILDRPKPLMKTLAPLALTSNPSRSFEPAFSSSPTRICVAQNWDGSTIVGSDIAVDRTARQRDSTGGVQTGREGTPKNAGSSSPIKKIASLSVDLGLPTTPPPRTPLPPVPRNNQADASRPDSYAHLLDIYEDSASPSRPSSIDVPLKSPARMAQIKDLEKLSSSGSKQLSINDASARDARYRDDMSAMQHFNNTRTPDLSSLEWPQPPNTGTDPDKPQLVLSPLAIWQNQKDDYLHDRAEKTNSLKRRHLLNTNGQIQSTRGSRETSKAPLSTVMELPSQQDKCSKSQPATLGYAQDKSTHTEAISDLASSKKPPNLAFSSIKVAAMIDPSSTHDTKTHHRMSRRTIYRSHSTQMTPGKHENRFDSESSTSNDESVLIHDQQQDLFTNSSHQETLSDNSSLAVANEGRPGFVQDSRSGSLDEAILDRIDRMMNLMEDRLYKKLSRDIADRVTLLGEKEGSLRSVQVASMDR